MSVTSRSRPATIEARAENLLRLPSVKSGSPSPFQPSMRLLWTNCMALSTPFAIRCSISFYLQAVKYEGPGTSSGAFIEIIKI